MIIFDLDEEGIEWLALIEGLFDLNKVSPMMPIPRKYWPELFGMIYRDKEKVWHLKGRLKFRSGSKQVFTRTYEGDFVLIDIITKVLETLPLEGAYVFQNKSGTREGILEILKEQNLIDSIKII